MTDDAKGALNGPDLIQELRKEGSSRSPEAVASSVPGDPWGIDVGLGHLLMQAADELERLRADKQKLQLECIRLEGIVTDAFQKLRPPLLPLGHGTVDYTDPDVQREWEERQGQAT